MELFIWKVTEAAGLSFSDKKLATMLAGRSYPQTLNLVRHYTRAPETNALNGRWKK